LSKNSPCQNTSPIYLIHLVQLTIAVPFGIKITLLTYEIVYLNIKKQDYKFVSHSVFKHCFFSFCLFQASLELFDFPVAIFVIIIDPAIGQSTHYTGIIESHWSLVDALLNVSRFILKPVWRRIKINASKALNNYLKYVHKISLEKLKVLSNLNNCENLVKFYEISLLILWKFITKTKIYHLFGPHMQKLQRMQ